VSEGSGLVLDLEAARARIRAVRGGGAS
jgi:hypothetical protein